MAKRNEDLEVKYSMGWREYFKSGMKRGVSPQPNKEMLLTNIDEATGEPTYQGYKILHSVSDGRGDDKEQFLVEVLYELDYVQSYLYDLLQGIGLIKNNKINPTLWDDWFNPETGKVAIYGATEGTRKQDEIDLEKAKQMAELVEGSTVEEWLNTIREKRQKVNSELEPSNGTKTTSRKTAKI